MNVLLIVNTYIKYAYYIIIVILIVLFIMLIKQLKPISKTVEEITNKSGDINKGLEEINKKIEKIEYTNEHSLPLFKYMLFLFIVLSSIINDLKDTKLRKRSIVKSSVRQYSKARLKYKPNKIGRKELMKAIRKATV